MQDYELLSWDTEQLGFKVAKILPAKMTQEALNKALAELRASQVKLVYWASDADDGESQMAAQLNSGYLADEKVTYVMALALLKETYQSFPALEEYPVSPPNMELEALAIESGLYSRFVSDPKFKYFDFEKIYKQWILNSTTHKIAKAVLVVKRDDKIVGMTTLGDKNNRGDIGLLAVDPGCRGMQIGTQLVKGSQRWCIENGYAEGQVVTQKTNKPACGLYEKCGYVIDKIENFYHFWLD